MNRHLRRGAFVAIFAALAVASRFVDPSAAVAETPASGPQASREKVIAALPALGQMAQSLIDKGVVPGLSIGVVFRGEVLYLHGFGVREAGKAEQIDADTVFQIASLSKPIASTIVAGIVGDGLASWDSRISDLDPSFQLAEPYPSRELTVADLFAHRSGLPGNAGNDLETMGYPRDEILHRLRYLPPAASFRARYAYSNFGLTEGAVAAAKASGKPWEDIAQERLYGPLGMTSTSSRYADFLKRSNRAALHILADGHWSAKVERDPDPQSPAGGVSSSARDLTQWIKLQLAHGKFEGKQLIAETAIDRTHQPMISRGNDPISGRPTFYGLGWGLDYGDHGAVWSHAGAFSTGAQTIASMMPDEDLGVVILSNAFPTGAPDAIAAAFFDLVFTGAPTRDWLAAWDKVYNSAFGPAAVAASMAAYKTTPASPLPSLPLEAYAGTYDNDYLGKVAIDKDGDGLWLEFKLSGKRFPLRHFDRDRFLWAPYAETPEFLSAITFAIGPDRKALRMVIQEFNADSGGAMKRAP